MLYRRSLLSYVLLPIATIIAIFVRFRRIYYYKFSNKVFYSNIPIISVGNITLGGNGKTPFTIYLAKLIRDCGYKVAISHRGYKGQFEHHTTLISNCQGQLPEAARAGDEPLLLSHKLTGIPVIVGKDRVEAIRFLENNFPDLDAIILDDSFQNLKIANKYDFHLSKYNPSHNNFFVIPAGPLREPLSTLKYTDSFVFINSNEYQKTNSRESYINNSIHSSNSRGNIINNKFIPHIVNKPVIEGTFEVTGFHDINNHSISPDTLINSKVCLISAIGQPASFEKTVNDLDINFSKHYKFNDHYAYRDPKALKHILHEKNKKYDYLLTTEKDWMKLYNYREQLPLIIVVISFVPKNEEQIISTVKSVIKNNQQTADYNS